MEKENAKLNLHEAIAYTDDAVVSRTILKKPEGTITLFAFDIGQGLSEHTTPFEAHVHILEGEAVVMLDADHDIDTDTFVFKSADGESELHEIKVWVDEDGEKHVTKDGVEIDGDTWTSDDGKTYDIKKSGGKVIFLSEDEAGEFLTEDGKHINVKVKINGEEGDQEKEMIFIETITADTESDGANTQRVVVKIVEEIKIHLADIEENEFSDIPGIDAKTLKINELNYYPNPSSGKFTLAFQASNKPTEIRITGVNGKEVYAEKLQSFEGSYSKEIDLSGQQPGIYLLQIFQGKKAMNKKIVIE